MISVPLFRKEPRSIKTLVLQIRSHPDFEVLDKWALMETQKCTHPPVIRNKGQVGKDNQYLRSVWRHLYWGHVLPTG